MAGGNFAGGAPTALAAAQAANSGDLVLTNGKFVDGRGRSPRR